MKKEKKTKKKKLKSKALRHILLWFEIPVINFERAKHFYEAIYMSEMEVVESGGFKMAVFKSKKKKFGALIKGDGYIPSTSGSILYLRAGKNINKMITNISEAGGSVVVPKTEIDNSKGHYAIFIDSEGNKLGLYSAK